MSAMTPSRSLRPLARHDDTPTHSYDASGLPSIVFTASTIATSIPYDAPARTEWNANHTPTMTNFYLTPGNQFFGESAEETNNRIAANPINRVDPTGLSVEVYVAGDGAWGYRDRDIKDPNSTKIFIDAQKIGGDLNDLSAEIQRKVHDAHNGYLIRITFTAHGIDDKDCKAGGRYEHYRGVSLMDPAKRGIAMHHTPLDMEDSLESTGGALAPAADYFFHQIFALGPGTGVDVIFFACNDGHGADAHTFLKNVANITRGFAEGFDGEVNAFGNPTFKSAVIEYPDPLPSVTDR